MGFILSILSINMRDLNYNYKHVFIFADIPLEFVKNDWTFYYTARDTDLKPKNVKIRRENDDTRKITEFLANAEKWHFCIGLYTLYFINYQGFSYLLKHYDIIFLLFLFHQNYNS